MKLIKEIFLAANRIDLFEFELPYYFYRIYSAEF